MGGKHKGEHNVEQCETMIKSSPMMTTATIWAGMGDDNNDIAVTIDGIDGDYASDHDRDDRGGSD